jgi:hypothetical protein
MEVWCYTSYLEGELGGNKSQSNQQEGRNDQSGSRRATRRLEGTSLGTIERLAGGEIGTNGRTISSVASRRGGGARSRAGGTYIDFNSPVVGGDARVRISVAPTSGSPSSGTRTSGGTRESESRAGRPGQWDGVSTSRAGSISVGGTLQSVGTRIGLGRSQGNEAKQSSDQQSSTHLSIREGKKKRKIELAEESVDFQIRLQTQLLRKCWKRGKIIVQRPSTKLLIYCTDFLN